MCLKYYEVIIVETDSTQSKHIGEHLTLYVESEGDLSMVHRMMESSIVFIAKILRIDKE